MISWVCRIIFKSIGWQLRGQFPHDINKMLIIVAPHTSAADLFIGLLVNFGIRIRGQFYGKKDLFRGLQGRLLRSLGGLPIDRSGHKNTVQAIISDIEGSDRRIIVITPEGTREKVDHFKTGFYYIAVGASIPILPAIFDYELKTICLLPLIYVTGDAETEIPQIEKLFDGVKGKVASKSFSLEHE